MEDVEKVVLVKKDVKIGEFDYKGANFKLIPFISAELELSLIKLYLEKYFTPNQDETLSYLKEGYFDFWLAEYSVKRVILEKLTNIDVYETNTDTIIEVFPIVSQSIGNYDDFKYRLNKMVEAVKDSKSVSIIIDSLFSQISTLISSFSSINPEELKSLADSIIGKLESSSIAPVFQEAAQLKETTKQNKNKKVKEPKVE